MASMTYIQAIGIGFPTCQVSCVGDGSVYTDLVWESGTPLPTQATLDAYIAANPMTNMQIISRLQFRKLFTLTERMAIDNASGNVSLPTYARDAIVTMQADLQVSDFVSLADIDTIDSVNMLANVGLIASTRVSQILSNTPPTV